MNQIHDLQNLPNVRQRAHEAFVERMLGGSLQKFFTEYWGRKPLYVPGAGLEYTGIYDVNGFLADLEATQAPPYLCVGLNKGKRFVERHATTDQLRGGVEGGCVGSIKLSRLWHKPPIPERVVWARELFGSLCRTVSMLYLGPARSEDSDLFLGGPQSHLGAHFDSTEVFNLQLFGERKWTVAEECRIEDTLHLAWEPGFQPGAETGFKGKTREIILRPGDALYVPAYGVHHVTGVGWSVSLSMGLRAYNEFDVIESVLETLRRTRYADYQPVRGIPATFGEAHAEMKLNMMKNIRKLLRTVEMTATGFVSSPLQLPPTLLPPSGAQSDRSLASAE